MSEPVWKPASKKTYFEKPEEHLPEEFRTSDIYWAAYCHCIGLTLIDVEENEKSRKTLLFEGVDAIKKASGFLKNFTVPVKSYKDSIEIIRDQIFGGRV